MSKLIPLTMTGDSPQGKQKVYFCCHPDDFEKYFEIVRDDVFKACPGCAIYYDSDLKGSYDKDDLLLNLSNMQLFVVAVTRRLLEEPSRVMELDIPFANGKKSFKLDKNAKEEKTCHIAVLPIMFENGLYKLFNENESFRSMQYLKRYDDDDTTLSFEEKLSRYLDAVLVSEEEKKRIKEEFLARIFLSYRKDDRAIAQKLMELVHKVSFCRDVAIWYDEYLVPGENWRSSIEDMLTGSDLFLLNVTKTLLKERNFVFREEYPGALCSDKNILSVQSQTPDSMELSQMHENAAGTGSANVGDSAQDNALIDRLIEKKRKGEQLTDEEVNTLERILRKKLIEAVQNESLISSEDLKTLELSLREQLVEKGNKPELLQENNDPEHLYYIGLAYKNNIDVEYNPDLAVSLLEKAGKGGYHDAFYTLGQMYEKGDSVDRDEDKAILFYYDYIGKQKKLFGTSKEGDLKLLLAYDAIGMIYRSRSQLSKAFDLYEELNDLLENMTSCYGSFQQLNLPASYQRLGAIKAELGDYAAALEYYEKARYAFEHPRQIKNIATEEDRKKGEDPQKYNEEHFKTGIAINYYHFGEICVQNRDIRGAKKNFKTANRIFEELFKTVNDSDLQTYLAKSYFMLGEVAREEGKSKEALEYYKKANELAQNAAKNDKDFEAQSFYAVSLLGLGSYYRDLGGDSNTRKAQNYYEEALKAAKNAQKLFDSPKTQDLLALVNEKLGIIAEQKNDLDGAKKYYETFLSLTQKNAQGKEENKEFQRNLSIAYEKMGLICRKTGDTFAAMQYYRQDEQICEKLAENAQDIQAQRDLSVCYDGLAKLCEEVGSYEDALKYSVRGLVLANALAKNNPGIQELDDVAASYQAIGNLSADVHDECLDWAVVKWRELYVKTMNNYFAQRLNMAIAQRKNLSDTCPIPKGFTTGVRDLINRYASDLEAEGKFAYNPHPDDDGTKKKPSCFGCLLSIIFIAIIVCGILQLTGLVDIVGWVKGLFGIA